MFCVLLRGGCLEQSYLRARGPSQARGGGACVFRDIKHQDSLLNPHRIGPSALQEGDADYRSAHSALLNDRVNDRPAKTELILGGRAVLK